MFEKYFNRSFDMHEFPYFVPQEEIEYNIDYAKRMVEEEWIKYRWREDVERGEWIRHRTEGERIASHGGLILEICAGPGGGFAPAVFMNDYDASIMISDLCPTVVREWQKHINSLDNPPKNVEYAAFDLCDIPFEDNSLDVISGSGAVINIEGDRDMALREIYRVLKPGGLFVFDFCYVTEEYYNKLESHIQRILREKYPSIFWDTLHTFDELGFSNVELINKGSWSNKEDDSILADLCRSLNTELVFSTFVRYCTK